MGAGLLSACSSSAPASTTSTTAQVGPSLLVTLEPTAGSGAATTALSAAVGIFERRASGLGIANDVNVSTSNNTVVLDLRGSRARSDLAELDQAAQLYFRPVIAAGPASSERGQATPIPPNIVNLVPAIYRFTSAGWVSGTYTPPPAWSGLARYATTRASQDTSGSVPVLIDDPNDEYGTRLLLGPAVATGDIVSAAKAIRLQTGEWVISASLTRPGTTLFNDAASEYDHEPLANDFSGQGAGCQIDVACLVDAPVIEATDFSTGIQVSGGGTGFTQQQAQSLALVLNSGALPVQLHVVSTQTSH
jgi:preprotein translocase subunit SecD